MVTVSIRWLFYYEDTCLADYRTNGIDDWAQTESRLSIVRQTLSILSKYSNDSFYQIHVLVKACLFCLYLESTNRALDFISRTFRLNKRETNRLYFEYVRDVATIIAASAPGFENTFIATCEEFQRNWWTQKEQGGH